MSFYVNSPFKQVPALLVAGTPSYVWGSFNDRTGPTQGTIVSDSGNGSTSSITIQILSGNIPVVGALFTSVGSTNAAGAYNFTNAPILSVSSPANPDQGLYTITVAGSGSSASAPDTGQYSIPQPEIGEALTGTGASVPVAAPFNNPEMQEGKSITASVSFPTAPTSATVVLQGALFDKDSEYVTIGTLGTTNGSSTFQTGQGAAGTVADVNIVNFRFYRLNCTALVSTGTIVGKIEC